MRYKKSMALCLALTFLGMTSCKEKGPKEYEEPLADFFAALSDQDEDDLLDIMGKQCYLDSVAAIYDEDPDYYRAIGYEDARTMADTVLETWVQENTEGLAPFTYTFRSDEQFDKSRFSEVESLLPVTQKFDLDAAYRVWLDFQCEDRMTRNFLENNFSALYVVYADEEWSVVHPGFTIDDRPWCKPAYVYLTAIRENDFESFYEDESMELYYDIYEATLKQFANEFIKLGYYDSHREVMQELGYDSIEDYLYETEKEYFELSHEAYGNFEFRFKDPKELTEEEIDDLLEEVGAQDMHLKLQKVYKIPVELPRSMGSEVSVISPPDTIFVGLIDEEWRLLHTETRGD